jgi:hypothetical protein
VTQPTDGPPHSGTRPTSSDGPQNQEFGHDFRMHPAETALAI